jgi:hypothetical protein
MGHLAGVESQFDCKENPLSSGFGNQVDRTTKGPDALTQVPLLFLVPQSYS